MKLGQLLLQRRTIDREQLRAALRRQKRQRRPVGEILLEMGLISRADLLFALRRQPHSSVDANCLRRVDASVRRLLPADLRRRWRAVPVALASERLVVAMTDPTDRAAVREIAAATGHEVVPVAADPDAIEACLRLAGEAA